jgi:hypothetical protein
MRLLKSEIDALACPPGRADVLVFDEDLTGFALRVTRKGTKTFIFQYRRGAQVQRLRLGDYGDLTPAQARKLAERARGLVAEGRDPAGERKGAIRAEAVAKAERKQQNAADAYTLAHLIDGWEALNLVHRRDRYRTEAVRALRVGLAGLLDRPAHALRTPELQRAIDALAKPRGAAQRSPATKGAKPGEGITMVGIPLPGGGGVHGPAAEGGARGEAMARRTRAYGHAAYAWAAKRNLVPGNPFAAVIVEGRDAQRDRVLSDAELGEVWNVAGGLGWPWAPYFRFLLLTLQRATETAGVTWLELGPDLAAWSLPAARTKNGRAHEVHLSDPARAILTEVRDLAAADHAADAKALAAAGLPPRPASPLVFTTTGKTAISGFSHAKARLDAAIMAARQKAAAESGGKAAALVPWRLHDFRRTGVTVLARLGVRVEVADRLLNHTAGAIRGVAAVYQRHDFLAERRAALDLWAAHVLATAEGRPTGANVVELRTRAATE